MDFPEYFKIPDGFFSLLGLEPIYKVPTRLQSFKLLNTSILYYIVEFSLLFALQCEVKFLIKVILSHGNFMELTAVAVCIPYVILSATEMIVIQLNMGRIKKIVHTLEELFHTSKLTRDLYSDKLDGNVLPMLIFSVLYISLIIVFMAQPITAMYTEYTETGNYTKQLAYWLDYPFNKYGRITYPLVFAFETVTAFWCIFCMVAANTFLGACMGQIGLQFRILAHDVRSLKPPGAKGLVTDTKAIEHVVRQHIKLIDICTELGDIFSIIIFLIYITSSVVMCLAGFQIVAGHDLVMRLEFLVFLITCAFQILNISVCGQSLIDSVCIEL